jgi:hypothetical protein
MSELIPEPDSTDGEKKLKMLCNANNTNNNTNIRIFNNYGEKKQMLCYIESDFALVITLTLESLI